MKLTLDITFQTDGDFCFLDEKLINPSNSFYNNAVKYFNIDHEDGDYFYYYYLECEGDPDGCRWAARDLIENLLCGGIRLVHYWVLDYLYHFLVYPKENFLWSENDVHYYDTLDGNYSGTTFELEIIH